MKTEIEAIARVIELIREKADEPIKDTFYEYDSDNNAQIRFAKELLEELESPRQAIVDSFNKVFS